MAGILAEVGKRLALERLSPAISVAAATSPCPGGMSSPGGVPSPIK
jgi:hypothetical protein